MTGIFWQKPAKISTPWIMAGQCAVILPVSMSIVMPIPAVLIPMNMRVSPGPVGYRRDEVDKIRYAIFDRDDYSIEFRALDGPLL